MVRKHWLGLLEPCILHPIESSPQHRAIASTGDSSSRCDRYSIRLRPSPKGHRRSRTLYLVIDSVGAEGNGDLAGVPARSLAMQYGVATGEIVGARRAAGHRNFLRFADRERHANIGDRDGDMAIARPLFGAVLQGPVLGGLLARKL